MQHGPSSRIAVLLLNTLRQFEPEPDSSRHDPAVASLERYVVRLVGELDAIKGDNDRPSVTPTVPSSPSPKILEILRNTLAQMDELADKHPEIGDIKDNLIRAVAELEESPLTIPQSVDTENTAIPEPRLPVRCREGPLPDDAGIPLLAEQILPPLKEKKRSTQPEAARDDIVPDVKSQGIA